MYEISGKLSWLGWERLDYVARMNGRLRFWWDLLRVYTFASSV